MQISIESLMEQSGVAFGTSGARGLATAMTDQVCYAYTLGFLQHLETRPGGNVGERAVVVGGDLRPSTPRIMRAVCQAVHDRGYQPIHCGQCPSPAVALLGLEQGIPSIMVTGSHIPDDRNGIKFNHRHGEILKADEAGIRRQVVTLDDTRFDDCCRLVANTDARCSYSTVAQENYVARYVHGFPKGCLDGVRLGVYQHSAVARELLLDIFSKLGAIVTPLGFSDTFIPVDTEAIRPEDMDLARQWASQFSFDAIVSTDGDSDRPMIADERGEWLRGDVAGILCARFLQADSVSVPVSCNTAVDVCGWFKEVRRTKIGSPFVIESMQQAAAQGAQSVVGYEANGGFLLQSNLDMPLCKLRALPTRDAVVLLLGVLLLARRQGRTVSQLAETLPPRHTASDRLKNFPRECSLAIMGRFTVGDAQSNARAIEQAFGEQCGNLKSVDQTDGLRMTFQNLEIVHVRPSGNAPELRCYNEASSEARVKALNAWCMERLRKLAG